MLTLEAVAAASGNLSALTPARKVAPLRTRMFTIEDAPDQLMACLDLYCPRPIQPPTPCPLKAALEKNGWDPARPPKLRSGYYMDPAELFYRVVRVQLAGGIDKAGEDGRRFLEMLTLLADGYMGKIVFKDQGNMSNLHDDMVQEAVTKCAMIVMRFSPWNKTKPTPTPQLNNAFAYFTTVIRNRYFETLKSPLIGSPVYLEDLKTENQSIGDLV